MRLWSLHPRYLDPKGLVALWREALLAQAVLLGRAGGYRHHPQLVRFRSAIDPLGALGAYLWVVYEEATLRNYAFDSRKIVTLGPAPRLSVTDGQLRLEWQHLRFKLERRNPHWLKGLPKIQTPEPHPLFSVISGPQESWEKASWAKQLSPSPG